MKHGKHKKAQLTLEYTMVIVLVVGVLTIMGAYIVRGFEGQLQTGTDQLADQYAVGGTFGNETFTNGNNTFEFKFSSGFGKPIITTTTSGWQRSSSYKRVSR